MPLGACTACAAAANTDKDRQQRGGKERKTANRSSGAKLHKRRHERRPGPNGSPQMSRGRGRANKVHASDNNGAAGTRGGVTSSARRTL